VRVPLARAYEPARARVSALATGRQAGTYISRGEGVRARGCTDQSEASILYPAEYLGRMPHVRGVVWGHPCTRSLSLSLSLSLSFSLFLPVVAFSTSAQRRRANVLRRPFLRISRCDNRAFPRETEESNGGNFPKRFKSDGKSHRFAVASIGAPRGLAI